MVSGKKNPLAMQETHVPWVRKISWRGNDNPGLLLGKSYGHRRLVYYSPKGCGRIGFVK